MDLREKLNNQFTVGSHTNTQYINGVPASIPSPYIMGGNNGLNKLEHFMLEITKVIAGGRGYDHCSPEVIVNRAQEIFEVLKKRIEGIEQKGLLSDNKS